MTIIDARGRLFGALNILDALVILLAGGGVAAALSSRGVVRGEVLMTSVSPTTLIAGERTRVRVAGRNFREDTRAYLAATGHQFFIGEVERSTQTATTLLSTPSLAEIQIPEQLPPGIYDLYLFEGERQVAMRREAFRVESPTLPRGTLELRVRFFVPPESAHLIRPGDRDQFTPQRPTNPTTEGAVVRVVTPVGGAADILEMHLIEKDARWIGDRSARQAIDVTLQIPVLRYGPTAWGYRDALLGIGAVFTLTTDRYRFHGVISAASAMTAIPDSAPPLQ